MRARNLLGLSFLVVSLVACATGGKFTGTGGTGASGGGDGASAGSGGQTTTTPAGGSGGSTTTTTTSSSSTTTTTTSTCSATPCKLPSPQCGCGAGEMCAIDNTGAIACHAEGDTQLQQPCAGLYSCVAGSLCVQTSSSTSLCTKYCDTDNECNGGTCLIQLNDPANPNMVLPGVTLCSDDCNPITGSGCPAGLGLGCGIFQEQTGAMRIFTLCGGAGNGAQGTTCTTNENCSAGSACFTLSDMSKQCLKYCNVNNPSCPAGTTCQDLAIAYKGVEYGACL